MMNLFATPVYKSSLGRSLTESEMQFIKSELKDPAFSISNYSSKNKTVLEADELKALREIIQQNLNGYFETVFNSSNDVMLQITQSWLTRTRRGESHHSHIHPNSIVSGVLYINVAEVDGINFYRNEDMIWYDLMRKADNYYNASRYFIQTRVGELILFPSNVHHGVREVVDDIERVSLAFNTFFSGELGRDDYSNSLKISIGQGGEVK